MRFTTLGHRHFAAPNPVHVRRQFINDGSFKKVIDSWFGVLPSEKRSHSCEMRRGTGANDGRTMDERGTGESGRVAGARALSSDGDGTRVRRRRRSCGGRGAVRGVSRRAETYVGQALPNGPRFRPIRPNCAVDRRSAARKCRTARERPSRRIRRFVWWSRADSELCRASSDRAQNLTG